MVTQQAVTVVGAAGGEEDLDALTSCLCCICYKKQVYSTSFSIGAQHGEQAVSLSLFLSSLTLSHSHLVTPWRKCQGLTCTRPSCTCNRTVFSSELSCSQKDLNKRRKEQLTSKVRKGKIHLCVCECVYIQYICVYENVL